MADIEKSKPEFVTRDGIIADADYDKKSHQLGGQLDMPAVFGRVPWRHHVEIFAKCHALDEALFYINKAANEDSKTAWRSNLPIEASSRAYRIGIKATQGLNKIWHS